MLVLLFATLFSVVACEGGESRSLSQNSPEPAVSAETEGLVTAESVEIDPSEQIRFERISVQDGLSQVSVTCILQDSMGFMWFGTEDGLNKYDGYRFTIYRHDPDNPNSVSNDSVSALYQDASGVLWVGTVGGGLNRFDRETEQWTHYVNDPDGPDGYYRNWITAIQATADGMLWIGTHGEGLYQFDPRVEQFRLVDESLYLWIQSIYLDRSGDLWVGTNGSGLYQFDRFADQVIHYRHDPYHSDSLSSDTILTIYEDRAGTLWVGTLLGGLDRFDAETRTFVHHRHSPDNPNSLSDDIVAAIFEDRSGTLWVGTSNGFNWLDRENAKWHRFMNDPRDPNSMSGNDVLSIAQDQSGALWVGTLEGGLNRVDPASGAFNHFLTDPRGPNSLSNNSVRAIWEDSSRDLWVGTDGGLNKLDRETGQWQLYQADSNDPRSLPGNGVRAIYEDPSGIFWIGVFRGGLARFNEETGLFTRYLASNSVEVIYGEEGGALWIGTHGQGLYKFDPQTSYHQHYHEGIIGSRSLSSNFVRAILKDQAGRLWVATDGGLDKLDPQTGEWQHYVHNPDDPHSLSAGWVLAAYEDRSGVLWVGTMGGGLDRFDPETESFSHYNQQDGLANDDVYGILEDDQGHLWISTNNGLSEFDPQTEVFTNYGADSRLPINKFMNGAYHKSESGEMFFGGVNGLVAFHPQRIQENPYIPPIVLTSLTKDGEHVDTGRAVENLQHVTFHWPDNAFEFEFAALNYVHPEKNQYAYMLEGFDEDWIFIDSRRSGKYTNLPSGTYTLRITGSNNDGVWNEQGALLMVTITPPFWATWWFRTIGILVVAGSVIGGNWLRAKSVRLRSHRLEHQVQERTSQLEALYRAEERMHRYLDLDQVLHALVDVAVDILQADKSGVWVWDESKGKWVMEIARGFSSETLAVLGFTREEGMVGQVAITGEAAIAEDALSRSSRNIGRDKVVEAALGDGIRSFILIPIRVGGETFGVFNASFIKPHAFGQNEQRLFMTLAQRASVAIENAQLYGQAQELAALEERQRLARDLHDAVTQTLFSTSLIAEVLPRIWEQNPDDGRRRLEQVRRGTRSALAEMRALLLELRPRGLIEASLGELLNQLAEAFGSKSQVLVHVDVQGEEAVRLPPGVHITLYRIAQEALNNVAKHARARQATVGLRFVSADRENQGRMVELFIRDDGRGFDPMDTPPDCLGLDIMRERAEAVGAQLTIESWPGKGTQVAVVWRQDEERETV